MHYLWQAWLNSGFSLGVGAAPSAAEGGATSGVDLEEDRWRKPWCGKKKMEGDVVLLYCVVLRGGFKRARWMRQKKGNTHQHGAFVAAEV